MSTKTRNLLAPIVALTLVSFTMAQPAYAEDHETQGDDTVTETYSWLMPDGLDANGQATWPQSLVGLGDRPAPCGVTYQVDTYTGTRAEIDSVVSDGVLTGSAEDGFLLRGKSWHFNTGAPCVVKVPFPTEPTITDPCGPGNAVWNKPADTDTVVWVITDDGRLIGEVVAANHTWPNGSTVNSWGNAAETNTVACPLPPVVTPPVTPPAPPVVAPPAPPAQPVAVAPVPVVAPVAVVQAPVQRKAPVAVAKPQLAETGAASGALALLGGALALSGVCLVAVGRKLRRI